MARGWTFAEPELADIPKFVAHSGPKTGAVSLDILAISLRSSHKLRYDLEMQETAYGSGGLWASSLPIFGLWKEQ
jgi:hypothetical protein